MTDARGPITIEVADASALEPWHIDQWSLMGSGPTRWVKTYITITDYNEDGTLDYEHQEKYRVRTWEQQPDGSVKIGICAPEDDDEPDVFPGAYWRKDASDD